jgi:hypothetical protein
MSAMKFCCSQMETAVHDPNIPVIFTPKFREFGIRILDGGTSSLAIVFCPWCGQKLPDSLRDDWFDKLEQLGVDPYGKDIPAEFTDERWYSGPDVP